MQKKYIVRLFQSELETLKSVNQKLSGRIQ